MSRIENGPESREEGFIGLINQCQSLIDDIGNSERKFDAFCGRLSATLAWAYQEFCVRGNIEDLKFIGSDQLVKGSFFTNVVTDAAVCMVVNPDIGLVTRTNHVIDRVAVGRLLRINEKRILDPRIRVRSVNLLEILFDPRVVRKIVKPEQNEQTIERATREALAEFNEGFTAKEQGRDHIYPWGNWTYLLVGGMSHLRWYEVMSLSVASLDKYLRGFNFYCCRKNMVLKMELGKAGRIVYSSGEPIFEER